MEIESNLRNTIKTLLTLDNIQKVDHCITEIDADTENSLDFTQQERHDTTRHDSTRQDSTEFRYCASDIHELHAKRNESTFV